MYDTVRSLAAADAALSQRLANVSLGVPSAAAAEFVLRQIKDHPEDSERDEYLHHAARFLPQARLGELYTLAAGWQTGSSMEQVGIVRALGRGLQERRMPLSTEVAGWVQQLTQELLAADFADQARAGIELASDFKPDVFDALATAAGPDARFDSLRPAAMDACAAYDAAKAVPALAVVLHRPGESMNLRQHAAAALARINNDASRRELLDCLQTAPERLALSIAAGLADTPARGRRVVGGHHRWQGQPAAAAREQRRHAGSAPAVWRTFRPGSRSSRPSCRRPISARTS